MELIYDTYMDEFYYSKNGQESAAPRSGARKIPINKVENYVFRVPATKKFEPFNKPIIQSRMRRVQEWIGNTYVSPNTLYMSGMITKALEVLDKHGEIKQEDYERICQEYEYGRGSANRSYWTILRDAVKPYLPQ